VDANLNLLSLHCPLLRMHPCVQAFNKVDVSRHDFALEWMADFDAYSAALEADSSYAATLSRSLSLVLDEFYAGMRSVGLSALTGEGMDELFKVGVTGHVTIQGRYAALQQKSMKRHVIPACTAAHASMFWMICFRPEHLQYTRQSM
jgi:hypothetical protein